MSVECHQIGVEDLTSMMKALNDLAEVARKVDDLYDEYERLTKVRPLKLGMNTDIEAKVEVRHYVRTSLRGPKVIKVEKLKEPVQYVLKEGGLIMETEQWTLRSASWIYVNSPNLEDIIILAAYEKLENLVTRLVEEVRKVSKEDAQKLEKLRAVVNAVKDLIELPT